MTNLDKEVPEDTKNVQAASEEAVVVEADDAPPAAVETGEKVAKDKDESDRKSAVSAASPKPKKGNKKR